MKWISYTFFLYNFVSLFACLYLCFYFSLLDFSRTIRKECGNIQNSCTISHFGWSVTFFGVEWGLPLWSSPKQPACMLPIGTVSSFHRTKKIELIRFLLKGLRVHINSLVIGVDDLKFGMMFLCGAAYVATLKFQLKWSIITNSKL